MTIRRAIAILVGVTAALALGAVAYGKSRPGEVPSWLSASERQTIAQVFGNARPVLISNISYPDKIAVVFEFQTVVTCGTCGAPTNAAKPHGRVVRVSFDRQTHLLTGSMYFCEAHGVTPPLGACLMR